METEDDQQFLELGFTIVEHIDDMISYWDRDLICRFANNAYLRKYSKSAGQVINKMHLPKLLAGSFEEKSPYIKKVLSGDPQVFYEVATLPDGKSAKYRITYFPDVDNGVVNGFYIYIIDISPVSDVNDQNNAHKGRIAAQLVEKVEQTLRENIFKGFPGITALAGKYQISESKLKKDFRQKYDTSLFSYYRNLQMEFAYTHLTTKRCSKNQMALMLNFLNPSNFIKCYSKFLKHRTGMHVVAKPKSEFEQYKNIIEQSPVAIAIFDSNALFVVASPKWIRDFGFIEEELQGKSINDCLPGFQLGSKKIYNNYLAGKLEKFEGQIFKNATGKPYWLRCTVTHWYDGKNQGSGLLIAAEDITPVDFQNQTDTDIVPNILEVTNEIMHIGAWTRDLVNNTTIWNKTLKQILEVPDDFTPDINTAFSFYKEGESRDRALKGLNEALTKGTPADLEVDMVSAKGTPLRARLLVYPEFKDGHCERLSGVFQFYL
jgi:PAS domain S-box-containing protein